MPPAKSKPAAPLPPAALPTMPSLDLVDQTEDFDDEEDDPQDENHLMNILYKLKNAKTTLDSSRQKKKAKQLIEQTSVRFASDADELVSKHHKRWAAKFGTLQQKVSKLTATTEEKMKAWEESNAECEKRMNAHKIGVKSILRSMADLEKEFRATKDAREGATAAEITRIRQQVADKLKQVQGLLVKTHARSVKDDKFTKIIKSFVASF